MDLVSRRELAKLWRLDHRHSLFKKLTPVHQLRVGEGKVRNLYAFDPELTPIKVLDFNRCERIKSDMRKAALIKSLEATHGQGWHERIQKLLK